MSNLYVDRIDNALRVLRTVPDKDFAMNSWRDCALGHCSREAWFNDQGFGFTSRLASIPGFEGQSGYEAGAKFFGIPLEVSQHLFVIGDGITGPYKNLTPGRRAVLAQLEVLRMKKLAEIETGGLIEVKDFEAVE